MKIQAYKGMKDYYPENKNLQKYIFNTWKKIALKYGFMEIESPIIEPLELFTEKSGEEIKEQLYTLEDKAGRKLALRPEITPSVARMIVQRKDLAKPIKWFSIPQCFRYEREQAGRARSFYQLNLDILGTDKLIADAELISIVVNILKEFGLSKKDFYVGINNRELIGDILKKLGVSGNILTAIDKKNKISSDDFSELLKKEGLNNKQIKEISNIFDAKSVKDLERYNLDLTKIKELFKYLDYFGVKDFCKLDLTIVRGLDYYTGTVFEVFDSEREFRAIAGGGRYDNLIEAFGGEKCPAIGFGMGDVVLSLFLERKGKLPKPDNKVDYFIAIVNKKVDKDAIKIAERLREKYDVDIDLSGRNLSKQLDYASKIAKKVIIIGEREVKEKNVVVRDMKTGKEKKIKIKDL